jgi:ABC-type sugar transport system permease subunit
MCLFPFHFLLFTGVLQEIPREVTRKVAAPS